MRMLDLRASTCGKDTKFRHADLNVNQRKIARKIQDGLALRKVIVLCEDIFPRLTALLASN